MNRPLDALECYENASRKCPSEESFVIETLNAYAGMGEFKKMQQVSGNALYVIVYHCMYS